MKRKLAFIALILSAFEFILSILPLWYKMQYWTATRSAGLSPRGRYNIFGIPDFTSKLLALLFFVLLLLSAVVLIMILLRKENTFTQICSFASTASFFFFIALLIYVDSTKFNVLYYDDYDKYTILEYDRESSMIILIIIHIAIIFLAMIIRFKKDKTAIQEESASYEITTCESKPDSLLGAYNSSSTDINTENLFKLKELLEKGVITQEEFDAKKKQLLGL